LFERDAKKRIRGQEKNWKRVKSKKTDRDR